MSYEDKETESNFGFDKFTYSETRTVNIGNYENVNAFAALSLRVRHFNKVDKTVTLTETEKVSFDAFKEDLSDTIAMTVKRVRETLDKREFKLREATQDHVDFNTLRKMQDIIS